jgi:hypothetical protein
VRSSTRARAIGCTLSTMLLATSVAPPRASAQSLSHVSVDSVGAIDLFKGGGTTGNPDASVDISSVIRIGKGWSFHVRPWFFKSSAAGSTWSKEIYQAAVRYEQTGAVSLRVDAGYIASPIGLGMLDMRADINPTIQPHLSYFIPLMPFDRSAPGTKAIAASYPLGANLTASTTRWDARAALVSSAPTREFALNNDSGNPAHTPVFIAGGGVTPVAGLRLGVSGASGRYATDGELKNGNGDGRDLRMWTTEAEYAVGYTKMAAEFTRERFRHGVIVDTASTWFVQAIRTLSPRWFTAARHETISAPPMVFLGPGAPRLTYRNTEGSVGYRLAPELTLRGSVTAVRWYTAPASDRRVGVQVVWSRRWW